MTAQVRIDDDVARDIDEQRGEQSRAGFVNDLLRETFAIWAEPEPPRPKHRSISSGVRSRQVRPGVRRS